MPGDWYKATTIMMSLEECYENYVKNKENEEKIAFSVFTDGCIFVDKILEKVINSPKCENCCLKKMKSKQKKSQFEQGEEKSSKFITKLCQKCLKFDKNLFLMVCLRLGSIKPNPEYFPMMKYLLRSRFSVGILGGRPRRALYFVGYQEDNLIIQDPHYVQVINCY